MFTMTGEQSQRERHEAAGQERGPRDRIRSKKQREEVPAGDEPSHELRGGALHRRQWDQCKDPFRPKPDPGTSVIFTERFVLLKIKSRSSNDFSFRSVKLNACLLKVLFLPAGAARPLKQPSRMRQFWMPFMSTL